MVHCEMQAPINISKAPHNINQTISNGVVCSVITDG
jgi:hypothetical protein